MGFVTYSQAELDESTGVRSGLVDDGGAGILAYNGSKFSLAWSDL